MSFVGKHAIVTGAGSGIGAALSRALADRGAKVVCADIDGSAAESVAAATGGVAVKLDVTDAVAVQRTVDDVLDRAGRLDFMFNNAGIFWGGDTEKLSLQQWNSIIDVNLRGVVHGIAAAYPVMIAQKAGHIINTASLAGLTAAGQLSSYVATKHAVVGLSLSLRAEAAAHGIGVLAVCPGAVETPILDKGAVGGFDGREYFFRGHRTSRGYPPDRLAADTLRAVEAHKALLVRPARASVAWMLGRLSPTLLNRISIGYVERQRRSQQSPASRG
ncbi:SDR family oxidoreductase [Mycobacterium aquaticum]|uniref:Short-chain dehydrogenase n=1 Tax=Mycobacterium aquaticum TaxID=1927124 RepID=A0A1X0AWT2_9MYCO|nr:SDR family oxidoreductase [Mycobacterium aquaticum]ORA34534.1 short-chain dehydrogenase [Mycobacterium aquaticum]